MPTLALMPGGAEIWIILAVIVLLFGGRKLPELARSMGSSITQFKKGLKDSDAEDPSRLEEGKSSDSAGKESSSKDSSSKDSSSMDKEKVES